MKSSVQDAVTALQRGEVIAYPTEAVFGLGCDPDNPDAINRVLEIKQRPPDKGLIIVAAEVAQLKPYIADLDASIMQRAVATWPGPVTWLIPVAKNIQPLLRGNHTTIAVRVSAHPVVRELCNVYGKPVVSTSANLSGQPPTRSVEEVMQQLGEHLSVVVAGEVDMNANVSEIRDLLTNNVIRGH